MSARPSTRRVRVVKPTRPSEFLERKAAARKREQRAFDRMAKRLVTWGRSR